MNFIRLTSKFGSSVHINFDLVESFSSASSHEGSVIIPAGTDDGSYDVVESPDEIRAELAAIGDPYEEDKR